MGSPPRSAGARFEARPHLSAALLLGLFVFAYLWSVLVGGEILSPMANLYGYVPWTTYTPEDLQSYYNPLLLDLPVVDYPWRLLARAFIHEGTFPAWNPYVLGGIPFFSNPQTGLFSPFNLPLWILPLTYGLGVSAALKLLAGAFGTYLLARQLRLGFLPGLLAGVAFAFSAVNITWLAHETLPGVVVMLPWTVLLVERIFARRRLGSAIGLAVVLAIGLGGGHPGMQVHFVTMTAVYAGARAIAWDREGRLRSLALVGGGLTAGLLLMAFMLIPEAYSSHDTVGVLARKNASLPGAKLPLAAIRSAVFPDWWGRPSAEEVGGVGNYCERTFYAGSVALLLAGVALVSRGAWRRKAPFVALGFLGLAIPLRAPGLYWLVTHLPVLDSVESQRLLFAFAFAVAVLAAFGLQALLDAPKQGLLRLGVPLAAVAGGIVAFRVASDQPGDAGLTRRHFLSGTEYLSRGVLAQTSVVWFLLFALGVSACLLLAHARPRWRLGIAVALVLMAAGDAYHFAHGFQPMGPAARVIPPLTPAVRYLADRRDDGRIVGLGGALPPDSALPYRLEDARGYDPPQPTERMLRFWRLISPRQLGWTPFTFKRLNAETMQVLSVLGTRYVLAEPEFALEGASPDTLEVVYQGEDATIIANADAAPRALVPAKLLVTGGERETRERIAERGFRPRTTVVVERDQPGVAALAQGSPPAHGSVTILRDENSRVTLRARLDRRGIVMLDDQLLAGWTVQVDGRPAPALHVDDVMRGVIVPAGSHDVVWSYRVPGLRLGAFLSLLALAVLAGSAVALTARQSLSRSLSRRG